MPPWLRIPVDPNGRTSHKVIGYTVVGAVALLGLYVLYVFVAIALFGI